MISQESLPACLKRKLVFGDREQIEALKNLEIQIKKQEEETKKKLSGDLKKFRVNIEYSGWATVEVWATDKKHAEELAEEMDINFDDVEVDSYYATEIKDKKP